MEKASHDKWVTSGGTKNLVSVMIPTYNRRDVVMDTLESVRRQRYRPLEVIIIDDGSDDGTESAIGAWKARYGGEDLAVVYQWQRNQGLAVARNRGVELSSGQFLQFLDSDDLLHPEKLSWCVRAFVENDADVVVPRFDTFHGSEEITEALAAAPRSAGVLNPARREYYIMRAFWGSSAPTFRREVVRTAGPFPRDVRVAEEIEFHSRIKCVTDRIAYLPHVLAFVRKGRGDHVSGGMHSIYRCNTAVLLEQTLLRYGIEACEEWRALATYAARSAYRVSRMGEREAFELAAGVARRAIRRSGSPLLGAAGYCPNWAWWRAMIAAAHLRKK